MAHFNGREILLAGLKGEPGETPFIGDNGNWWIGTNDTGVKAEYIVNNASVVQTTGDSESAVMSQRAVSTLLENTNTRISQNSERISNGEQMVNSLSENMLTRISRNDKRITNLEQGIIPDPFEVDDSVVYSKDVPENALPYAEVQKVGGMSYKSNNLIPYPYNDTTKTVNGITFTDNGDGSISVSGTATAQATFTLIGITSKFAEKTLSFSGAKNNIQIICINHGGTNAYDSGSNATVTIPNEMQLWISVASGVTVSNTIIFPMLNEGATALPYEPYFEGLRSAPVTEVVSMGANLLKPTTGLETSGCKATFGEDGLVTLSATTVQNSVYARIGRLKVLAGKTYRFTATNVVGTIHALVISTTAGLYINANPSKITYTPTEDSEIFVTLYMTQSGNIAVGDTMSCYVMVNYGETPLPYVPYKEPNTLPIPKAVQALDGYGWGVSESVHNYIDWDKKQFVKQVGKVDLGTLTWSTVNQSQFCARLTDVSLTAFVENHLCAPYTTSAQGAYGRSQDDTVSVSVDMVWVYDTAYTDSATFKAAMSGVMLYYELATPEVTDISDLITEDNFIEVEPYGTLTFENEHKCDVPSMVVYQLKEVTE